MNGRNDIIRPGQVKRQNKGALTSASEVMDWNLRKSQEEINKTIGSGGSGGSGESGEVPRLVTHGFGGGNYSGDYAYMYYIVNDPSEIPNDADDDSYVLRSEIDAIISDGKDKMVSVWYNHIDGSGFSGVGLAINYSDFISLIGIETRTIPKGGGSEAKGGEKIVNKDEPIDMGDILYVILLPDGSGLLIGEDGVALNEQS